MGTNDTFCAFVRDLPRFTSAEVYREHYTELTRQVNAEGTEMTSEAMHAAILCAHNQPKSQ